VCVLKRVMMESKTDDDGDGVQPVVVRRVETMPAFFWFKLVMFLAYGNDASAMHATSKAVRDHTAGRWQRIQLSRKGLYGAWHFAMFRYDHAMFLITVNGCARTRARQAFSTPR